MSVVNVWIGGVTASTAIVKTKVVGTSVRVAVNEKGVLGTRFYGPVTPTAQGIATVELTGLEPLTEYEYRVEVNGTLDGAFPGRFKTFPIPGERADFTYGMATCAAGYLYPGQGDVLASNRLSSSAIFATIQRQLLSRDNGLFFMHGGDAHYYDLGSGNHGITGGASLANYRRAYDDLLLQEHQHSLYRNMPLAYVWDDHDYGPNNSDGTHSGRNNACQVYRERVPSYPLPEGSSTGSIYHSFQVGRVLFIMSDVRSNRSPNSTVQSSSKTMLGSAQKAWMEQVLTADTGAEALVWCTPSQWIANDDSWSIFLHEKAELTELFGDTGWLSRMCINTGDAHALAIDTGGSNTYGYFPNFVFSSLDSSPTSGPNFDTGPNRPGHGQYGLVDVRDNGHTIEITGTGYNWSTPWRSHTWYAHVGTPVLYLDYSAGRISPPFEPTDDDQRIVNDVTAKRMEGGEVRHEVTDGPLSVQEPPFGVGRYDASVDLNVESDEQLAGQAGWRTHLGTVDEARFPKIRLDLTKQTDLREEVTELDTGDKLIIDNTPSWLPPEPIEALVEGYDEELTPFTWDVTFNASPASPYTIGEVVADVDEAGPATPDRCDTSESVLVGDIDADTTEIVVRTTQTGFLDNARWINSEGSGILHPEEFPFDIRMNGEVMGVEASRSFAYDAFGRTLSSAWGTSDSGETWSLAGGFASERSTVAGEARVLIPSSLTTPRDQVLDTEEVGDCDVVVTLSFGALASGGSLAHAVMLRRESAGEVYLARVHGTTAGNLFLSFATSTGQVGTNVNSGYRYTAGQRFRLHVRLMGHRLLMKLYPESTEFAPLHWQLDRTAETGLIDTGKIGIRSYAFSGNTNTNVTFAYRDFEVWNPQRFTVERGINTVEKSHEHGSRLSLDNPADAGL